MVPNNEAYIVLYIFLTILFLILAGVFYYLYSCRKKGEIWDGDTLEGASAFQTKIKREEEPISFEVTWWRNLLIAIGMIAMLIWILSY